MGISMILKSLLRRRIIFILLLVIPAVFLLVVDLTTSARILPFRLASLEEETFIEISERRISFVFFAVACAGFLVSFLALNLIQRNRNVNKRLIICGYHPLELQLALLGVLLLMIVAIAAYVGMLAHVLHPVDHVWSFVGSLMLIGVVYGCYGLAAGSLIKGELEGILMIVLLVNIDVGWLQNPLFYAEAQNQAIIRFLPAYYPSQSAIITAFTDHSPLRAGVYSLLYGALFLLLSIVIFFLQMRTQR